MRGRLSTLQRPTVIVIVMVLAVSFILPFIGSKAFAYGEITSRSVALTSSAPGATGVTYTLSFKPATTGTVEGVVLNLCDDTPLIDTNCAVSASSAALGTLSLGTITGSSDTTHWSVAAGTHSGTANDGIIVAITDSTADTFTAGTAVTIPVNGITNPTYNSSNCNSTTICSFYGRIETFTTAAAATGYTPTVTTETDAGGVALSTAAQINITAKVEETLSFCVYNDGGTNTNTCTSGGSAPTFNLGNTNGVLLSTGPFVDDSTMYSIQTNAGGGVVIDMQGNTLETAGNTANIPALTTAATADTGGTSQFGFCTWEQSGTANEITPQATSATQTYSGTYSSGTTAVACSASELSQTSGTAGTGGAGSGTTAPLFYFGSNISTTGGDEIASAVRGNVAYGEIGFVGNTSASQQAGVYTTTLGLIANATF